MLLQVWLGQAGVVVDLLVHRVHSEVVHGGDGLDGVAEDVAFLAAVAEDLPVLHAGEGVLDAGADAWVFGVVFLLAAQEGALAALLRCGMISPVPRWAPSAIRPSRPSRPAGPTPARRGRRLGQVLAGYRIVCLASRQTGADSLAVVCTPCNARA